MNLVLPRIDDSESDNGDDRIVDGLTILANDYVGKERQKYNPLSSPS